MCAHSNDGACHAREILAYQETIAAVRKFVDEKNAAGERTILISTSDHETGGLTLGRQLTKNYPNYAWYPERLLGAKQSAQMLSAGLVAYTSTAERTSDEIEAFIRQETLGSVGAGFAEPTDEEVAMVAGCVKTDGTATMQDPPIDIRDVCRAQIAETMSRRAEIGWSTCEFSPLCAGQGSLLISLRYQLVTRESTLTSTRTAPVSMLYAETSRTLM